ncbi:MAG: PAS domain S-box protein [Desulfotomaculaceae bacterium]|nr:PAS domain S-box protein [Desulfotomaculaceae bacterium]
MSIIKEAASELLIKCNDITGLTKGNTPDIKELETVNLQLKEDIEKRKRCEEVLDVLLKHTICSVAILDKNYNFLRVNEAYAKAGQRNICDFPGHNHFEFYPSDAKEIFDSVVRTKEIYKVSARPCTYHDQPERGLTYCDWALAPVLDSSGEVDLLVLTLYDITEHVRFKEKLSASEERYRSIYDNGHDGIILSHVEGPIISANPAVCRMFGGTEEELCAAGREGIFDLEDPNIMIAVKERDRTGSYNSEMTLLRKDGTKFPGEVTSNLFKDQNGRILASTIIRDITKRKKSEEALRLSEEKFSKAFYNSQAMMSITRLSDNQLINVNKTFAEALGYNRKELIGKRIFDLKIWADLRERQDMLRQLSENEFVKNLEIMFKKRSGESVYAISSFNFFDLDGDKCLLSSFIDITDRKKIEDDLRISEELFFTAFNTNPLPMIIVSMKHGAFVEVNEAFIKRNGYDKEELMGVRITDINHWLDINEHFKFIEDIKKEGSINNYDVKFRKKTGEIWTALLSGVVIMWKNEECTLAIANDITELRRYQSEIARLERLNLIGEMSASISHEIRNPMTTVRGFLQLFLKRDRYTEDKEYMLLMIEELDRANSIITEFLSLAKNKAVELKSQNLNKVIENLVPLLQAEAMKQDKNLELELGDIPYIIFDKNEMHQLILNLVLNGLEAMSAGGYITIKTFKERGQVVLAVQDQGTGISPEVLEKIGTPFFTTKDNGTGLGVAICYSIAQRHNARIDIKTDSKGTTFYVRFKA